MPLRLPALPAFPALPALERYMLNWRPKPAEVEHTKAETPMDGEIFLDKDAHAAMTAGQEKIKTMIEAGVKNHTYVTFGKYIQFKEYKKLGSGSYGQVLAAVHVKNNITRKVAVKFQFVGHADLKLVNDDEISYLKIMKCDTDERSLSKGVPYVYHIGKIGEFETITMDRFYHRMEDVEFKRPREMALKSMISVVRSLKYMHKMGILHRDVKAENIFFQKDIAVLLGSGKLIIFVDFSLDSISYKSVFILFIFVADFGNSMNMREPDLCRCGTYPFMSWTGHEAVKNQTGGDDIIMFMFALANKCLLDNKVKPKRLPWYEELDHKKIARDQQNQTIVRKIFEDAMPNGPVQLFMKIYQHCKEKIMNSEIPNYDDIVAWSYAELYGKLADKAIAEKDRIQFDWIDDTDKAAPKWLVPPLMKDIKYPGAPNATTTKYEKFV